MGESFLKRSCRCQGSPRSSNCLGMRRVPRPIQKSGSTLRKLIKSLAAVGFLQGEAMTEKRAPRTTTQRAGTSQGASDRLLKLLSPIPIAKNDVSRLGGSAAKVGLVVLRFRENPWH